MHFSRKLFAKWGCFATGVIATFLVMSFAFSGTLSAASWMTGISVDGQKQPLTSFVKDPLVPEKDKGLMLLQADPKPRVIDLVISLESNPEGDDRKVWVEKMEHFADAIFEMTNGGHKVGNVRIYRDSANSAIADAWWANGTRGAYVQNAGGIASGGRIFMFDPGPDYDNPEIGGYTLAHEMGHYFYGLFDEYSLRSVPGMIPVEPSIMTQQRCASDSGCRTYGLSNDKRWLNFSIANSGVDPAGPFENTKETEQHHKLAASGWQVLSRSPNDDPCRKIWGWVPLTCTVERYQKHATRQGVWLGPRVHYAELAAFAPEAGDEPDVLLPDNNSRKDLYFLNADGDVKQGGNIPAGDARQELRVIWMTDEIDTVIVIDKSGSMSATMLGQAKTAARLLVNQLSDKSSVRVTAFDSVVEEKIGFTRLATEGDRDAVKDAIDSIQSGGMTAIGDAARNALNSLLAESDDGDTRIVFLLTDGLSNSGENPRNVILDYQNAQIPLFTFGFGSGADTALMIEMAQDTGGKYFFSPTTLTEISQAFQEAGALATFSPTLKTDSLFLEDGAWQSARFIVDPSISRLTVSLFYVGAEGDTVIELVAPDGTRFYPSATTVGGETAKSFDMDSPMPGEWTLNGKGQGAARETSYSVRAQQEGLGYDIKVWTDQGMMQDEALLGSEIVLHVRLTERASITGATLEARKKTPSGEIKQLLFVDDGTGADAVANDGLYTASFIASEEGTYSITVNATNDAGTAQLTNIGSFFNDPDQGEGSIIGPVTENFSRQATYELAVGSVMAPPVPQFETKDIQLSSGWNLISLPIRPGGAIQEGKKIENVLNTIEGKYDNVWSYENGEWKAHDPNLLFRDLETMVDGVGYWINMDEAAILTVAGDLELPPSIFLTSGWNLVGYNAENAMTITDALASIDRKYISVWAYENGSWKFYDPAHPGFSNLERMKPGLGYWINASQGTSWALD